MTSTLEDFRNLNHNDVTRALAETVVTSIAKVEEYNKAHATDSSGPTTADIDKMLVAISEGKFTPGEGQSAPSKEVSDAAKRFAKAQAQFKEIAKAARDALKQNVLGQEVSDEPDTDEEEIKQIRKVAYETVSLIANMAKMSGLTDVQEWAERLPVPQVGRQGVSLVGQTKPRAQVKMGETVFDSFALAAKGLSEALSDADTKVEVKTGDLIQAWTDAGSPTNTAWTFRNTELVVVPKETKK